MTSPRSTQGLGVKHPDLVVHLDSEGPNGQLRREFRVQCEVVITDEKDFEKIHRGLEPGSKMSLEDIHTTVAKYIPIDASATFKNIINMAFADH